ncbi:DUF58 domain-containing protein [Granulicella sp. 5B5]|uniref:DUF58 domain-containing protein n=1 Tax=Granulicella sp. 5B5 TaxID=1617967 RepID=UPI0015F3CE57|nr:DUF58 domain-containing protein [Granulicella sp. 5B5]QMV19308.1 DUF58 domain-containing protein [Granulicella sp. 5B5]
MQILIPQPATATAAPRGKLGRALGFGLTPLTLILFCIGLLFTIPAFFHPHDIYFMCAWDVLLGISIVLDLLLLPRPDTLTVTRTFLDSPQLGAATRIELAARLDADKVLDLRLLDDLHDSLTGTPATQRLIVFPREDALSTTTVYPRQRGDFALGSVYLRYRGVLKLAERWAVATPVTPHESKPQPQRVRVYPAHEDSRDSTAFYLLRARQIEMQKRRLQLRGVGRDFDSLRDYQPGDELRNISWTATARRGKLVTRQFTVERSQQVWMVIDAGRLSRTAFELKRDSQQFVAETSTERESRHLLTVTQLDQATTAATMLAQVINGSGDKFGMMAYGRGIQQLLPPGNGPTHLRLLIDLLSQTRSEAAEADALQAVARMKNLQQRRGMIVWITELVDSAGRPEIAVAAAELVRRHLIVLVVLKHPELEELAARTPRNRDEMFHSAAAQEMLERRRETIAQMERSGVLVVETTAAEIGIRAVSKYLEVKAEGLL